MKAFSALGRITSIGKRAFVISLAAAIVSLTTSAQETAAPAPDRPTINIKDFGAKGECQRAADGIMHAGSPILTSASAHFTAQDVGLPIYVLGASVQKFPDLGEVPGAPLSSRIIAFTDAHTVTLADPAQIDARHVSVTWGTDDSDAIQRAMDSLGDPGGTIFFPAGTYRVVFRGRPGIVVSKSNIRLQGIGPESAIFNSTVIFHAKMKDGVLHTEQAGVPVLYVGQPKTPTENVEIDHLWLGDNGQGYDYAAWGPHGPAVIGSAGKINHFSFHDLTVVTDFLCGVGTDSETDGFSIHHVNCYCTGEHGFYLAGTGDHGDVHDNRIIGVPSNPMRIGMAIKKKSHLRVANNEIANAAFQGISVIGDDPTYISRDVLIADNWLHDLAAWHTDAITIFNAENVRIEHNHIADTSWIGINLRTTRYVVSNVIVRENTITRTGQHDPAYAIAVHYDPLPNQSSAPSSPPGSVHDITIQDNLIQDCPFGISVALLSGHNLIRNNRVEGTPTTKTAIGYNLNPAPGATLEFTGNSGTNCAKYNVAPEWMGQGNDLQ